MATLEQRLTKLENEFATAKAVLLGLRDRFDFRRAERAAEALQQALDAEVERRKAKRRERQKR